MLGSGLLLLVLAGYWLFSAAPSSYATTSLAALLDAYRPPIAIPFPADNPYSPEKAALGRRLFFDARLSGPQTVACVTCHQPARAWTDANPTARGVGTLTLRSPTLIDVAWIDTLGWDGKFGSIEAVTFSPITIAGNMGGTVEETVARLSADAAYRAMFRAAFGDERVDKTRIEQALATYERGIVSEPSAFDRWVAGDEGAVGEDAKRGFAVFTGKAGCSGCHSGWAFTDGSFHDIGTATGGDIGRGALFPTSAKLRYAFKTPTLRNVAQRGYYMHDGSMTSLRQVIDHYDEGGIDRPSRAAEIHKLALTEAEKSDLLAFLASLSGATDDHGDNLRR